MTVIMDNKSSETLFLVRGKTYERPRGKSSLRADATNCNLKGKWPKEYAEFAKLWRKVFKKFMPSIKEVVIGIYLFHMFKVEVEYRDVKENMPERFNLYRINMRKTFNKFLIALDMDGYDIDQPLTKEVLEDPDHPAT